MIWMKAVITAGGKGTRMRPLTFSTNKHFIPLANKPLLFYAIEAVVNSGIKEIGINYNPGQLEEIKSYLSEGEKWGAKFTYIFQEKPLGLANIVKVSQPFIGKDKFVMHLGDNIFYGGIKPLVDYFKKADIDGLLTVIHHPENFRMGVPFFDKNGKLVKYVEKPSNPPHDWGVPGLYFANHHIFECFEGKDSIKPSARGEYEIPSAFQWLIDHKYKVETKEFSGVWKDPGKFDDWLSANQFLLDKQVDNGTKTKLDKTVRIEGRVKIGKNCQIENSLLRGPVIIGDDVKIKNSFIGPYSSVGDDSKIENSRIENSVIMKKVQIINVSKQIDSSVIGEETTIRGNEKFSNFTNFFIGNQCVLKL